MPAVNVVITCEIDGHPIPSSPFLQIGNIAQIQAINVQMPVTGTTQFVVIPTVDTFTSIGMLLLMNPDADLMYRFNGQTDQGLEVLAGGLVLISGSNLDSGAGSNILCNNSSSNGPATIIGFVGMSA